MFGVVRRLTEALECLVSATEALRGSVVEARDWSASQGNVEARIEELERQRTLFEAEVHSELLKAQAEYRKAGNAEKRAQKGRDAFDLSEDGADESFAELNERYRAWALANDGTASEAEEMQRVLAPVEAAPTIVDTLRANRRRR